MRRLLLPCLALAVLLTACELPVTPTPTPTPEEEETPFPTPTRVIGRPTDTPVPVVTISLSPTRGPGPGGPTIIAPFGTPIIGPIGTPLPELITPTGTPLPTPTGTPRPPPSITVDPATVDPGARIVVRGANWVPGQGILITLGESIPEAIYHMTTAVVLGDGHFETAFFLPDRWSNVPALVVRARNYDSSFQAIATFTIVAPTPTPVITGWYGEYFGNRDLRGKPILVRDDRAIDFNWDIGAPAPGMSADNFSVRWTSQINIPTEGIYEFNVTSNDGVKMFIDERLYINDWQAGDTRSHSIETTLSSGKHRIRLEYFDATGPAMIKLDWKLSTRDRGWSAEYYNNTDLGQDPVLRRFDSVLDFNWGNLGPGVPVKGENFSAYWTRRLNFETGRYGFYADADDGVRVWLDLEDTRKKLIDEWHTAEPKTYFNDMIIPKAGRYSIDVAFLQLLGDARVHVWRELLTNCIADCPDWVGEYYDNPGWRGQPAFRVNEGSIDFNWQNGGPDNRIKADHFSVRWTRTVTLPPGTFRFEVNTNGIVNMWIDDYMLIVAGSGQLRAFRNFGGETTVRLRVEFVGVSNGARIQVGWKPDELSN
ncbi:MAG: hypothetical protein A2Z04_06855 [Chloroflexi bacterium RBG_16_57_9]|nr:MAG: hypothetical protein A2Z04_06855 [Chloroflexi bacterium RBG_16_57_9]